MSDLRQNLKTEFQEPEYRYGYAESFLNTKLATQIKTLREEREKTQAEAAALMGIKQPGYRRFEDVNHSVWKTDTLWNIARAYGVRVDISFKSFGSLLDDKESFDKEALRVPAFEDDPAFKEAVVKEPEPEEVLVEAAGNAVVLPPVTGLGLGSVDQEGIQQVRAAAAAMWLKPAGSTELGGFANPGVLQPAGSGLLQSPMRRILSFSVSDSTTVSDSASGVYDPAAQPEIIDAVKATSTPAPINTQQSVPEISQPSRPERIENPLRRKAA
jgi:transcriptional regulator with XRE-family HTH domain